MIRRLITAALTVLVASILTVSVAMAMDSKKVDKAGPDLAKAREHIKKEEWAAAINLLGPLRQSHPTSADVHNLLGFAQRKSGQFDNSLASYKRALELDPVHLDAHVYLGELYIQTKNLEKAAEQAKIVAKLCPKGCKPRADLEAAIANAKW